MRERRLGEVMELEVHRFQAGNRALFGLYLIFFSF